MSAFDLAGDHDSASLIDQARLNPLDLSQPAGFFTGMGRGAVTGVGRLLADTQRTTGLALGAVAGSFDMLTGDAIKAQEKVFENIVAPADKLSRHLAPKPDEIGMAGQLLHGLIKIGGEAVAFGAPGVLVNETVGGTLDALDKGVDLQTAGKVGGVQGAAMTAGVIAPMTLGASGLGMNVLYGAGINLAQGIFQRGATAEIYANAGRPDLALQFKALDGEAMAVDAILGAAFAGGGRFLQIRGEKAKADAVAEYKAKISEMLAPEQIDAALVKNEQLKIERPGFGLPADLASRDAHVANMRGAIEDMMEGRPVTMREPVGDTIPDPAAAKVQADVEEVLRPEMERSVIALHGTDAVFDQFQIMPGRNPALFFSVPNGRKTQAEFISEGPFGGNLYKVSIADGKKFDPLNDPTAAKIYADLFPERAGKPGKFIEYTDIYIDSPLIQAMRENGYNRVRVYEPSVQAFSEAVTDPTLIKVLERNGEPVAPKVGADTTAANDPAATARDSLTADSSPESAPIPLPDSIKPDTVIPIDDTDATTTVAEAQGIITDLETAAREQETGLRAAVACFLRAA